MSQIKFDIKGRKISKFSQSDQRKKTLVIISYDLSPFLTTYSIFRFLPVSLHVQPLPGQCDDEFSIQEAFCLDWKPNEPLFKLTLFIQAK